MAAAFDRGAVVSRGVFGLTVRGTPAADLLTGTPFDDRLYGLAGNDRLIGLEGADLLDGGRGADRMAGGDGDDTYYVDDAGDRVVEGAAAAGGVDTVHAGVDFTLGANVENLTLHAGALRGTGNGLANVLIGNGQDNVLRGLQGDDTLLGRGGNDTLDGGRGVDRMEGGGGNDVFYVDNTSDQTVEAAKGGRDTVHAAVSWTLGANIETLVLHGSAWSATGNDLDNHLVGTGGDNILTGGFGDDTIDAGAGDDTIHGWNGGGVIWLDWTDAQVRDDGADIINGGAGSDTYVIPTWFASDPEMTWPVRVGVTADLGAGTVTYAAAPSDAGPISADRLSSIENITTGFGDDTIIGSAAANRIDCGGGINTVRAGAGNDVITGGTCEQGDDPGQTILERLDGGSGNDTIYSGGSYWSYSDIRADRHGFTTDLLFGGTGNDRLVGGLGDIRMSGGSGADVFEARCDVYLDIIYPGYLRGLETTTTTVADFDPTEGDRIDFRVIATGVDDSFQKTKRPAPTYVGETADVGIDEVGYTHVTNAEGGTDTVISYRFPNAPAGSGEEARPDLVFRVVLEDYDRSLGAGDLLFV